MSLYKGLEEVCKLATVPQQAGKTGPGIQACYFGYIVLPLITHSTNIYQLQLFQELEMQRRTRQTVGLSCELQGEERKQTANKQLLGKHVTPGPESSVTGPLWLLPALFGHSPKCLSLQSEPAGSPYSPASL